MILQEYGTVDYSASFVGRILIGRAEAVLPSNGMAAFGRKQPLKTARIHQSERPVLGKADITLLIP